MNMSMATSDFNKCIAMYKKYDALVNFVRLQESMGNISPNDATELLNDNPSYKDYLRQKSATMEDSLVLSSHGIEAGIRLLKKTLLRAFPDSVKTINELEQGPDRLI